MKTKFIWLLKFFLVPFKIGSKNYYRFRDIFYTNSAEHLHKIVQYVNRYEVNPQLFDQIIDVGAADGLSSLFFHNNFKTLKIIGFEPNPEILVTALKNTENHKQIQIEKYALDFESGISTLEVTVNPLSTSLLKPNANSENLRVRNRYSIEKKTLDSTDFGSKKTLIMKLDTQGTELRVFKGAIKTLANTKFIVCEMMNHKSYENAAEYHEIDAFLRSQGFKLIDIIVSYRAHGGVEEFDAIYLNTLL